MKHFFILRICQLFILKGLPKKVRENNLQNGFVGHSTPSTSETASTVYVYSSGCV